MSHKKFGPDRFSCSDVYRIQTNRQTDKPNSYIDVVPTNYKFIKLINTYLQAIQFSKKPYQKTEILNVNNIDRFKNTY